MKVGLLILIVVIIAGALMAVLYVLGPSSYQEETQEKIEIAATIFPLQSIAQEIGGDLVDVKLLLPPGASPHTFEPTAQDVADLEGVDLSFAIGHGLDEWIDGLVSDIGGEVVVVDKDIKLDEFPQDTEGSNAELEVMAEEDEHTEHHEQTGQGNPHYWLTAENGKKIAKTIYDQLSKIDPENSNAYQENLAAFDAKMDTLNQEIQTEMIGLSSKDMVTFHNAWGYFAKEYGLNIVAVIEAAPGKEPSPQYLANLQEIITKNNIKTIFAEPQLSTQSIQGFLDDLDVSIEIIDPMGGEGDNNSYEAMMRNNSLTIQSGLSK
ncbi:metal ABC transporter substrate-binding protein [Patescibacteria group bacterium]